MAFNPDDFDLASFILPSSLAHPTRLGSSEPKEDRYGIALTTPPRRWEEWVVKLQFNKSGGK